MSLTVLPDDALSTVVHFLTPRDFYSLKTVITVDDSLFWYDREITLSEAVRRCPSLTRYVLDNSDNLEYTTICDMVHLTQNAWVHKSLYSKFVERWPKQTDVLNMAFVEHGANAMFSYSVARNPSSVTLDTMDLAYLHSKWLMMSQIFIQNPRIFIDWVFGNYRQATDPEVVNNLRYVLLYLHPRSRAALATILTKYHEWLWSYKLDRSETLKTVVAIHRLEVLKFEPERYLTRALNSPCSDFLEYLLVRGMTVEPYMFKITHDFDKLKMLYSAQVVQKYHKILVILFILIVAIMINLISNSTNRAVVARLDSISSRSY